MQISRNAQFQLQGYGSAGENHRNSWNISLTNEVIIGEFKEYVGIPKRCFIWVQVLRAIDRDIRRDPTPTIDFTAEICKEDRLAGF